MPGVPGMPGQPEMTGYSEPPPPLGAEGGMPAPDASGMVAPGVSAQDMQNMTAPQPAGMLSAFDSTLQIKMDNAALTDWDVKAEQTTERWTEILDRSLERLFERQQRVILEKAAGARAKKALDKGSLSVEAIFDSEVWAKQLTEDIKPVINAIAQEGASSTAEGEEKVEQMSTEEYAQYLNAQVDRLQKANETTREEIAAALLIAMSLGQDEDRSAMLRAALIAIFANLLGKRRRVIAEHEAQTAFNAGIYFGGLAKSLAKKTWLTRRDARVRPEHLMLQGKSVPLGDSFTVDGAKIRFPGDPLAPAHLTMNCRCRLRFQ